MSTELSFSDQNLEAIPALPAVVTNLDLSHNRVSSLSSLGSVASTLTHLILDSNEITETTLSTLPALPRLDTLWLNRNKLSDLTCIVESLKSKCPRLRYLSLLFNPCCPFLDPDAADEYARCRIFILYNMPSIQFLDASEVLPSEVAEAKRSGPFVQIAKVQQPPQPLAQNHNNQASQSQQPSSSGGGGGGDNKELDANIGQKKSFAGVTRVFFHGRQSEGNRFIVNNDL
eukprot:ANDGO_07103.mRNA.1 leucine-rich repeat-containing protein C10